IESLDIFVIPTGIFVTCNYDGEVYSFIKRVKKFKIDLHIIDLVNDFSRKLKSKIVDIDLIMNRLSKIEKAPEFSRSLKLLFGGITGGFFSLMFNGNLYEFIFAFITSFFVVYTVDIFSKKVDSFFITNVIGGIVNSTIAITCLVIGKEFDIFIRLEKIIIGSIMPLVPGVAFTNAIRDSISGDFVSGVSKLLEAIVKALGIALGVGLVLNVYFTFT
ncbi:MAG: threonine/serine ThrE exporter family protein, partial [Bacillota bacterium]